eukprot:419639-Pleurochrysis_carterae.AAC.2
MIGGLGGDRGWKSSIDYGKSSAQCRSQTGMLPMQSAVKCSNAMTSRNKWPTLLCVQLNSVSSTATQHSCPSSRKRGLECSKIC